MKPQQKLHPLRKSSSLILLYPNSSSPSLPLTLLLKRKSSMSFSNSYVFPGGTCDSSDRTLAKSEQFLQYSKITAIREYLEESGLLLYPAWREDIVVGLRVQGKGVGEVCGEIGRIWDGCLGLIQPVLRLMTPQIEKGKRFDCIFHLCIINQNIRVLNHSHLQSTANISTLSLNLYHPHFTSCTLLPKTTITFNKSQSDSILLQPPQTLLKMFKQNKIQLAPPQIIILSSLTSLCSKENSKYLGKFCQSRERSLFGGIEPIMFRFDVKRAVLRLFGDQGYGYEGIVGAEPDSDSKREIEGYFQGRVKQGIVGKRRMITLRQNIRIISDYQHNQPKSLLYFLPRGQETPKL